MRKPRISRIQAEFGLYGFFVAVTVRDLLWPDGLVLVTVRLAAPSPERPVEVLVAVVLFVIVRPAAVVVVADRFTVPPP
jgi:hypothetical protein